MPFEDLRELLAWWEQRGELREVRQELSPRHEVAALMWRAEGPLRLLKVKGSPFPVVGNLLLPPAIAEAMGVREQEAGQALRERVKDRVPLKRVEGSPLIEEHKGGLSSLPILTHYEADSGPFITAGLLSAEDPEGGPTGRGIHRMEVRGDDRLGVALLNPPLAEIYRRYRDRAEEMPVAVALGLEPAVFLAGALRVEGEKLEVAGALRGKPVEVTTAPLTGIKVPAKAEFLIEGFVTSEEASDGPMGEVGGYYLKIPSTPTMRVERIWHRPEPLYHALLPWGRETDGILSLVAEASLGGICERFPFVQRWAFVPWTFGSSVVLELGEASPGEVRAMLLWVLSSPMVKKAVAVPQGVDPGDLREVEWAVATRCQPSEDLVVLDRVKGQVIDPSAPERGITAKVAVDATGYGKSRDLTRVSFPPEALERAEEVLKG